MHKRFTLATAASCCGLDRLRARRRRRGGSAGDRSPGTFAFEAPGGPQTVQAGSTFGCEAPTATIHCYTPADIRSDYGVNGVTQQGAGQTIVLVDSYGEPDGGGRSPVVPRHVLSRRSPNPNFDQVFPNGKTDFNNSSGNGKSGPNAAAGWSGEATLDIEWSYAIAPLAHIVLIAVPPAETEGVQGLPNLFKAISDADRRQSRRAPCSR